MDTLKSFEDNLYTTNEANTESIALELFHWQAEHNPIYNKFVTQAGRSHPFSIKQIPFLPISFFKTHSVKTGHWEPEAVFSSSGSTGVISSRHLVKDTAFYCHHAQRLFELSFGKLNHYHVLALLPSYLERDGSSLVLMASHFIAQSQSRYSGFFLNDLNKLVETLIGLRNSSRKVLLLGVSFALLDLAERYPTDLSHCLIMETGGMKGRRQEIVREELHAILCKSFNVTSILSEYGMTELLSQAYSFGNGLYNPPRSLKILIRDINDPLEYQPTGRTGAINVIDFANFNTCAFIETADLGKVTEDGSFEVLGRLDNSDIRGCNLLVD